MTTNNLGLMDVEGNIDLGWKVKKKSTSFESKDIKEKLLKLEKPCFIVQDKNNIGISHKGSIKKPDHKYYEALAFAPVLTMKQLGDIEFRKTYGVDYALYTGSMANRISSEEMIIKLGKNGILGSFGAGGLVPDNVEKGIINIQKALPEGPYAFNLIHNPKEPALEQGAVDLYHKYGVHIIEAAAYIELSPQIVYYRVKGLSVDNKNEIHIKNRIIAKISRREVAIKFMEPAPVKILQQLVNQNHITEKEAELAAKVPMADDITVEADSGGHTDNRPLVSLLPSIISLRNDIQKKNNYKQTIRVGAGGGIGTPHAALATFMMGAAYVVTGSINQGCVESGASEHTKQLLTTADMADVAMAPSSDMFEMGGRVQVLKRGTLFPMRAQKLFDIYNTYASIDDIPAQERAKIEKMIFQRDLESIWKDTVDFFKQRDPAQIEAAANNPKRKMSLIFRWYLGLSSKWSNDGEKGREMDYQIWCGPALGAFNEWTKNTYLEEAENRKVVDVNKHILKGAAYFYRIQTLKNQGVEFPVELEEYLPEKL